MMGLITQEDFIAFSHCKSFVSYMLIDGGNLMGKNVNTIKKDTGTRT
jgi:hypothetical protein